MYCPVSSVRYNVTQGGLNGLIVTLNASKKCSNIKIECYFQTANCSAVSSDSAILTVVEGI